MAHHFGASMEDQVVKSLIPKLEAIIVRTLERDLVPGAAIGIVRDQELIWSRGFGYADLASDRAMDADTLFRCGSITKTFTATVIIQLRDEGKLSIDDPIVRYIPEFAAVLGVMFVELAFGAKSRPIGQQQKGRQPHTHREPEPATCHDS